MNAVISAQEFTRRVCYQFHVGLLRKLESVYTEGEKSLFYFEEGIERFRTDFSRRDLKYLKVFWVEIESLNQQRRQLALSPEVLDEKYRASLSKFHMTEQFIADIGFFLKASADTDLKTVAIEEVERFAIRNRLISPCMICANAHLIKNDEERGWEFAECESYPKQETPVFLDCNGFRSVFGDEQD